MSETFNPHAVTLARRAKSMTQDELARAVGVRQAAVSQWEKGVRVPEIDMLPRLAAALEVLPLTLVDESVATTTPMFRASGVDRKKDEKMIEGRTELARLAASRLLAEVEVTPTLPWPTERDPLGDDPEDAAAALRRVWRIPSGPIANLTKIVEAAGAIVLRVDFGHPGVEAAYAHPRRASTRWLVLNTFMDDWARMRITLAHELGHAMLHHWDAFNVPEEKEREREAYRFALALMVPADDFILDIAHTGRRWNDFLRLRHKWGISAAALARRAYDLKLLDPKAYRSINIERRKRGHWKLEPGDDAPIERPKVFPATVSLLRDEAGWTEGAFAETTGLPYARLSDFFPDEFAARSAPDVSFRLRRVK
jgi:Zn-dependent peptidase ImmA (M78 family)/DNA-binding XRE family transcriptional regulator